VSPRRRPPLAARVPGGVLGQKKDDKRAAIVAAAATVAATAGSSSPALAVVEEIMGGEGVGLPLGVSSSGLTWIITGMFTLIWALYFVSLLVTAGG